MASLIKRVNSHSRAQFLNADLIIEGKHYEKRNIAKTVSENTV